MARTRIVVDLSTGEQSVVPYTPEEEDAADAAYEAEQERLAAIRPDLQPYQFWAMLELSGYKDDLDAYVDGLEGAAKVVARAKLDRALTFRRDNELVEDARAAIGLTDEQLDALWVQAAAL